VGRPERDPHRVQHLSSLVDARSVDAVVTLAASSQTTKVLVPSNAPAAA
jgi:hypothetical protein